MAAWRPLRAPHLPHSPARLAEGPPLLHAGGPGVGRGPSIRLSVALRPKRLDAHRSLRARRRGARSRSRASRRRSRLRDAARELVWWRARAEVRRAELLAV